MPADYEMMVAAASPPVFSHSPPASTFLAANYNYFRYSPFSNRNNNNNNNNNNHHTRKSSTPDSFSPSRLRPQLVTTPSLSANMAPRRPCLVIRAEEAAIEEEACQKNKKRVVFADDRGFSLTQVRVMSEPSHCPPIWTVEFLAQVTKGVSAEVAPDPWEITFPQPASDYVQFRQRLDSENVSLENVIVKEAEQTVVGTVKVRNLSFHKEVLVRATFDEWDTHEDAFCTFVPNNPVSFGGSIASTTGYVLYDTFSFKLTLQPRSRKVEFCVCFRCNEQEYWDNNNGKNYILLKSPSLTSAPKLSANNENNNREQHQQRFNDALRAKIDSWSEFASWNHLVNDGPYW